MGRQTRTTGRDTHTVSIVLNGEARLVDADLSVAALIRQLGLEPQAVMVERNRDIMARADLDGIRVRDRDRIEVVQFVGGG